MSSKYCYLGLLNLLCLLVICDGIKYGVSVFSRSFFKGILNVSLWIFVVLVKVIIVVIFMKRFGNFWKNLVVNVFDLV